MRNDNLTVIKGSYLSDLLGKLGVLAFLIAFYFYLLIEVTIKIPYARVIFLLIGYICLSIKVLLSNKIHINNQIFLYYSVSIFLFLMSFPFWTSKFDINVYLSTISAILIIDNYNLFLKVLKIFILITFGLATYEFLSKEYLFVVMRETSFGLQLLDEKLFGGEWGLFRAKVFFEGPLALSQFAIGASFLFRNNIRILAILLMIAIFANGRLGMILCALMMLLYFFKKYNIITFFLKPQRLIFLLIAILLMLLALFSLLDETSIERLKLAFNTSNAGNSARINFWISGWKTWIEYDIPHLIFGNNGYFESIFKNNAENGWLTLLLNNGILGFLYYALPVVLIIGNFMIKRSIDLAYIFLFVSCMFLQTFHLGASANLFYWLIIYSFLNSQWKWKRQEIAHEIG